MQKYVFSTTLAQAGWTGTTIVADDVVPAVRELKEREGGDLVVYGFGRLGHTLLEHDLVDELNLAVHPVVLGSGELHFRPGPAITLTLTEVERRPTGVVSVTYTR
jgi:dihydrofolate reductase